MAKKEIERPKHFCRDCEHAYDYHEKSFATGKPFMARCPFNTKRSVFLNWDHCENIKLKDGKG